MAGGFGIDHLGCELASDEGCTKYNGPRDLLPFPIFGLLASAILLDEPLDMDVSL